MPVKGFAATVVVLWLLMAPASAAAQSAVFVVRHAERADTSADSPLSAAGHARAERLAEMLRSAGITQIVTTNLQRTQQTAAPLATALRLTPAELAVGETALLVSRLEAARPHERVLVVGHSNTVPEILKGLGVAEPVTIADTEYDNLFVVMPQTGASVQLVRLRY